jgi:MFS family permease
MHDNPGFAAASRPARAPMTSSSASSSVQMAGETSAMTPLERRSSISLASIFALRMLGLFLVLPVFALEAARYPGGDDPARIGLAMGIYGLTQAFLQMPLGLASDRMGRKRVIVAGLLVFAFGSLLGALADSVTGLLVARALQGAGAVSAAVTALLADQTRDVVRTKAMALVGASIGLMFALSLVLAPLLAARIGLAGIFGLTGALALLGAAVVAFVVPAEAAHPAGRPSRGRVADVFAHADLSRLNLGVFVLHTVQMAMWVAVPGMLVAAGLARGAHWQVYLPAVLASFVIMGGVFPLERRGHLRAVLLGAIGLVGLAQVGLGLAAGEAPGLWTLGLLLFVFFCGFNVLEATQPSLVSRLAPPALRGAALGLYNTLQSVGLFAGGVLGGLLLSKGGAFALFGASSALVALWFLVSRGLRQVSARND